MSADSSEGRDLDTMMELGPSTGRPAPQREVLALVKGPRETFVPDFVICGDGCHLPYDSGHATESLWSFALLLLH